MGLNAYFTYQVVGFHGSGQISYGLALTAVFVEGFVFVFLSLIGMRQWLVKIIPASIKIASGVGIGLFLTEIGLSGSAGIGAITAGGLATPIALGGCSAEYIDANTGACTGHLMTNPAVFIQDCEVKAEANYRIDVDRHLLWGCPDRLPDGLPLEDGDSHWDLCRFNNIMAVSYVLNIC